MADDMNKVTSLLQDLITRVGDNRATRESISEQANDILRDEHERLRLLSEHNVPVIDKQCEYDENDEYDKEFADNVALKMELQRLKEAGDKSDELVDQFENSIMALKNGTAGWVREYEIARERLVDSYEHRLEEERSNILECKQDQERLYMQLQRLHSHLVAARESLPTQQPE